METNKACVWHGASFSRQSSAFFSSNYWVGNYAVS